MINISKSSEVKRSIEIASIYCNECYVNFTSSIIDHSPRHAFSSVDVLNNVYRHMMLSNINEVAQEGTEEEYKFAREIIINCFLFKKGACDNIHKKFKDFLSKYKNDR